MDSPRRPSFAEGFPRGPELDALVEAFARGDYARVRADARKLRDSPDAAVQAAARLLVERTEPDPIVVRLFWIAAVLLVVLAGWWIVQGKPPPGGQPQVERAH